MARAPLLSSERKDGDGSHVAKFSSRTAYTCMGKSITFAELDRLSAAFGAFLQGRGLKKGARVALMMPNILQYPVCLFGTLRAGCVVVNTNPLYTARELEHQLSDSGAEIIVVVENFAHTVAEVVGKMPVKQVVVTSVKLAQAATPPPGTSPFGGGRRGF